MKNHPQNDLKRLRVTKRMENTHQGLKGGAGYLAVDFTARSQLDWDNFATSWTFSLWSALLHCKDLLLQSSGVMCYLWLRTFNCEGLTVEALREIRVEEAACERVMFRNTPLPLDQRCDKCHITYTWDAITSHLHSGYRHCGTSLMTVQGFHFKRKVWRFLELFLPLHLEPFWALSFHFITDTWLKWRETGVAGRVATMEHLEVSISTI